MPLWSQVYLRQTKNLPIGLKIRKFWIIHFDLQGIILCLDRKLDCFPQRDSKFYETCEDFWEAAFRSILWWTLLKWYSSLDIAIQVCYQVNFQGTGFWSREGIDQYHQVRTLYPLDEPWYCLQSFLFLKFLRILVCSQDLKDSPSC